MVLRVILGILLSLIYINQLAADELQVNPLHPNQYTVVKGDTLWGISAKFLKNPWEWPSLWRNNPQIKDAHWIYPGDTLYFSYVNGEPRLSLSPFNSNGSYSNEVVIEPRIRESSLESAIPMIPSGAIAAFLNTPKVVNKDEITSSPYILNIGGVERLVGGAGDKIYVRAILEPTTLTYSIYRPGQAYISPETNEVLGYEADYVGDATLIATGDPASLIVNKTRGPINQGDRLIASSETPLALNYYPKPPEQRISGHIIRVMGGVTQIGQHDIVVIDKGLADGLQPGHTLNIYRSGRIVSDIYHSEKTEFVKLPDEQSGMLMIFRPFEKVSYALIMDALGPIHTLDRVETP